jgi:hypothetical protein
MPVAAPTMSTSWASKMLVRDGPRLVVHDRGRAVHEVALFEDDAPDAAGRSGHHPQAELRVAFEAHVLQRATSLAADVRLDDVHAERPAGEDQVLHRHRIGGHQQAARDAGAREVEHRPVAEALDQQAEAGVEHRREVLLDRDHGRVVAVDVDPGDVGGRAGPRDEAQLRLLGCRQLREQQLAVVQQDRFVERQQPVAQRAVRQRSLMNATAW